MRQSSTGTGRSGGGGGAHRGQVEDLSSGVAGLKASASAGSDMNKSKEDIEMLSDDVKAVPQITVSDNEKETTSGQVSASEDDDYDDAAAGATTVARAPVPAHVPASAPAVPVVSHYELQPTHHHHAYKMPSTDASSSRKSERSDERSIKSSMRPDSQRYKEEKMPVSVGLITVVAFIFGGAILFSFWEDWKLFDGAYYSFITLSTIGFGDIVPGTDLDSDSQEKLIICSLYLLFGMALIAMCFKLMQDDVVQKARWLGQKIGILVHEESSEDESEMEEEDEYEDEEDEMSDERTDDKRTMSSGSSKREDDYEPVKYQYQQSRRGYR